MNEEAATQDYLVNLLGNDATLSSLVNGVWTRSVPATVAQPTVKIDALDRSDLYVVDLNRVWADMTFLVRGIAEWPRNDPQDWTEVRTISDRIDALLQAHQGQDASVQVHAFREESYTDETVEGGSLFLHAGGIYRVRAHALP